MAKVIVKATRTEVCSIDIELTGVPLDLSDDLIRKLASEKAGGIDFRSEGYLDDVTYHYEIVEKSNEDNRKFFKMIEECEAVVVDDRVSFVEIDANDKIILQDGSLQFYKDDVKDVVWTEDGARVLFRYVENGNEMVIDHENPLYFEFLWKS
jgi:hypothetical protein